MWTAAVLVLGLAPSAASAAPTWLAPVTLSSAGQSAPEAELAVDGQGDVLAVWTRSDGSNVRVEAAYRPAGGSFTAPQPLSAAGSDASSPRVAFDGQGNAIVVWSRQDTIEAALRPAGGSFGAPVPVSPAGQMGLEPRVAIDAQGSAVVVWWGLSGTTFSVQAAVKPAGGSFGAPQTISGTTSTASNLEVAAGVADAVAVWSRSDGSHIRIEAAIRQAGGAFAMGQPISDAGQDAAVPQVAFDPAGNATAVWVRSDGTNARAQAAFRPAGGSFGAAQTLSDPGNSAATPDIALDSRGDALVVWQLHFWIQASFRPAGGSFGPVERISAIDQNSDSPRVAFDGQGNAVAVWENSGTGDFRIQASARPAGGDFGSPQYVSDGGVVQLSPRVAFDGQGDAVALWRRSDGTNDRAELAGYDAAPPVLRDVVFPPGGLATVPLGFSATAFDVWSPVSIAWQFGDGASGTGSQVTHAYGSGGSFAARVTATDAVGNATGATATVSAVATAPAASTSQVHTPPVLSALRVAPTHFRAAASGPTIAAAKGGTTISYRLSEAARVRFTVQRATAGRRVGKSCARPTAKNRRRARCVRYVAVKGSFAQAGRSGADRLKFSGRLERRRLAAGRYRLIAVATDAAGTRSPQRTVTFVILSARRR